MERNLFIFVHYFFTISLFIQSILIDGTDTVIYICIYALLLITLNFRTFFIYKNKNILFLLCLTDWVLYTTLYMSSGFIPALFFVMTLSDCFYYNKYSKSFILAAIGFAVHLYVLHYLPFDIILNYAIIFLLCIVFLFYVKNEHEAYLSVKKKTDALNLKNSELEASIHNMEMYVNSIEDLILLKERNRISREIHDSAGHGLSTIIIQLNALSALTKNKDNSLYEKIENLNAFAKNTLQEIRFALRELKPADYNKYETIILVDSLIKEFKKITNIHIQFTFSKNIWNLTEEQNHALYKSVQEFLSNSGKHGKPAKIEIHFSYTETALIAVMKDNGKGCEKITKGIGLTAICERVNETGGTVFYESLPRVKGFYMRLIFIKPALVMNN